MLVVFAQYQSELRKLKIFDQNFGKILHENDADEVLTSPCNMSIAGVKSSNVYYAENIIWQEIEPLEVNKIHKIKTS